MSTPVRGSAPQEQASVGMMTPVSDGGLSDLVTGLSGVKIATQNSSSDPETESTELPGPHGQEQRRKKRTARDTVEGSPFLLKKKPNDNPTPAHFQTKFVSELPTIADAGDTPIKSLTSSLSPVHDPLLTVIVSSSDDHVTGNHQENGRRTELLVDLHIGCLRRPALLPYLHWIDASSVPKPPLTDLLRVHDFEYLQHLEHKCRQAAGEGFEYKNLPAFAAPLGQLDCDTPLVPNSLEAAKRFCGASMAAVDVIFQRHFAQDHSVSRNQAPPSVFVIGRPPGHHAGPSGCVPSPVYWRAPGMTSSGFCLLNTVAVAAAYARGHYGRQALQQQHQQNVGGSLQRAPRVAIVDIDIHHGNGTEEIVRNLTPHMTFLPLPSSWAPVSRLTYKPWLDDSDAASVLFSSVHLFQDEHFYPCSGQENSQDIALHNIVNICLTPLPVDAAKGKAALSRTKRDDYMRRASLEFREKITRLLLPKLREFEADVLFISAGFDAHYHDLYHFLHEEDLHWVTAQLRDTCWQSNPEHFIGTVSILEGGYSLQAIYDESDPASGASMSSVGKRDKKKASPGVSDSAASASAAAAAGVTSPQASIPAAGGKYAQQASDGGLVRSVLAHAAALSGKQTWA